MYENDQTRNGGMKSSTVDMYKKEIHIIQVITYFSRFSRFLFKNRIKNHMVNC